MKFRTKNKLIISLCVLIGSTQLSNCAQLGHTSPGFNRGPALSAQEQASSLLEQARSAQGEEADRLRLRAGELLLEMGDQHRASLILERVRPARLEASERARLTLALTRIALANNELELAEALMTTDRLGLLSASAELEADLLNEVSLLRASVWEQRQNYLAAARERIFLAPMLAAGSGATHGMTMQAEATPPPAQYQQNHEQIWIDLTQLPTEELMSLAQDAVIPDMKAWLQLAAIHQNNTDHLDNQLSLIREWQTSNPHHAAAIHLPTPLQYLFELAEKQPTQVALLLPMADRYLAASQSILAGYMTAYYHAQANQAQPLAVRVYDTMAAETNVAGLYQQAIADGAEMVIGPLQKEHFKELLDLGDRMPVTTLALNSDEDMPFDQPGPPNLYQFSLAPEDDARAVATRADLHQFKGAAVIYQKNPWWQRAANAFTRSWADLGHTVNAQTEYTDRADMAKAIQELLQVSASQQRAQRLQGIIGRRVEFHPRRRQDIDFIYVITSADQARQLRPMLDFYYAEDIPVLSGSQIYDGTPNATLDRDLNTIEFADIPWLLDEASPLKNQFDSAWPATQAAFSRLHALGVDAYRLQTRIFLLANAPGSRVNGATGLLSVEPSGHIKRELSWATFSKGVPVQAPELEPATETEIESDTADVETTHRLSF